MPEGPSIVILREEAAKFAGKRVRAVSGNSRQDIQRMAGQRLRAVCSWGKHFLLAFDGFALRVHFLLFGRWAVDARRENANPRVSLAFDDGELNLYACSVRFIEGDLDDAYDWSGDVMAEAWDPAQARRKLKARPGMLAADALLEQDIFAGVGNIIKNEVLWRIRVHPESTIGALPPRKLGELIGQAREYSFDFLAWKKAFVLKKHYQVHTKQYCPRDGERLSYRKALGEKRRRAFFCEACQVLYREPRADAGTAVATKATAKAGKAVAPGASKARTARPAVPTPKTAKVPKKAAKATKATKVAKTAAKATRAAKVAKKAANPKAAQSGAIGGRRPPRP